MKVENKILAFFKLAFHRNITSKGMSFASEKSQNYALDVIEKHDLEAHYYLPSVGKRNDEELSNALDLLSISGFIITDSNGNLVGKVAKKRLSSQEKAGTCFYCYNISRWWIY